MIRSLALILTAFALSACVGGFVPPSGREATITTGTRIKPSEASAVAQQAASQVKRCYRAPRVPSEGRRIVTRLRVRYGADGMLEGLPLIVYQEGVTQENQRYAGSMAEAASAAVVRCTPLTLPPELHRGGWDVFDLTFSPRALV